MRHVFAPEKSQGFALTEVLVSILLLAIAMLGAAAALVDCLAGQRAALLQTRAADLAANLAEALRAAPDAASAGAEIDAWVALARSSLPLAEATAGASPTLSDRVDIQLRWQDGRGSTTSRLQLQIAPRIP